MPERHRLADLMRDGTGRLATRVAARARPHAGLETRLGHHLAQVRARLPAAPTPNRMPALVTAFARTVRHPRVLQIGANDGQDYDPLRRHIRLGRWRAWLLEPVPDIHERLVANTRYLKRVTAVNLAIGPQDGWMPFHRVIPARPGEAVPAWYDKVGSFDRSLIVKLKELWPLIEDRIERIEVECVTIRTLLTRYPIGVPDLVHIDAEGFDGQVLRQILDEGLVPGVLLYEHAHLGAGGAQTASRLQHAGYALFQEGMDTIAVHRRLLEDGRSPLATVFGEVAT